MRITLVVTAEMVRLDVRNPECAQIARDAHRLQVRRRKRMPPLGIRLLS